MIKTALLSAAFLALAAVANAQSPPQFSVDSLQLSGSGCTGPQNRAVFDGRNVLLTFSGFSASPDRLTPPRPVASCTLTARVRIPRGTLLTLGPSDLAGSASARESNPTLTLATRLFTAGMPGRLQSYALQRGAFTLRDPGDLTLANCSAAPADRLIAMTYSLIAPRRGSLVTLARARLAVSTASCG